MWTGSMWKDAALLEYQSIRTTVVLADPAEDFDPQCDAGCMRDAYGYTEWDPVRDPRDASLTPLPNFHPHDGPNNTYVALRVINETAGVIPPPPFLLWQAWTSSTQSLQM